MGVTLFGNGAFTDVIRSDEVILEYQGAPSPIPPESFYQGDIWTQTHTQGEDGVRLETEVWVELS